MRACHRYMAVERQFIHRQAALHKIVHQTESGLSTARTSRTAASSRSSIPMPKRFENATLYLRSRPCTKCRARQSESYLKDQVRDEDYLNSSQGIDGAMLKSQGKRRKSRSAIWRRVVDLARSRCHRV